MPNAALAERVVCRITEEFIKEISAQSKEAIRLKTPRHWWLNNFHGICRRTFEYMDRSRVLIRFGAAKIREEVWRSYLSDVLGTCGDLGILDFYRSISSVGMDVVEEYMEPWLENLCIACGNEEALFIPPKYHYPEQECREPLNQVQLTKQFDSLVQTHGSLFCRDTVAYMRTSIPAGWVPEFSDLVSVMSSAVKNESIFDCKIKFAGVEDPSFTPGIAVVYPAGASDPALNQELIQRSSRLIRNLALAYASRCMRTCVFTGQYPVKPVSVPSAPQVQEIFPSILVPANVEQRDNISGVMTTSDIPTA